jgi:hypothetical protein
VKHSQTMGTEREGAMLNRRAGAGIANVVVRATRGDQQLKDMTGKVVDRLTVVRRVSSFNGQARWLCVCSCGAELYKLGGNLRRKGPEQMCTACKAASK